VGPSRIGKGIEKIGDSAADKLGRWLTNISITCDTPPEKVEETVAILDPEFPPRVFFDGFQGRSLNITVLIWYHPADYWSFQACLRWIGLEIPHRFQAAGIDSAFSSRTVYPAGDGKRILKMMLIDAEQVPPVMPDHWHKFEYVMRAAKQNRLRRETVVQQP
jgi:MscS family membrane protein